MTDQSRFQIERLFDAPPALVWRLWTDPVLLARWYGPNCETIIHRFDLQPGGEWRNEMKWGEKSDLSKMTFQQVTEPHRLMWHHVSADKDWNSCPHPMMPDWPEVIATEVTLEPVGNQTRLCLTWLPLEASEAQTACFDSNKEGFGKGWESGFNIIDDILLELNK